MGTPQCPTSHGSILHEAKAELRPKFFCRPERESDLTRLSDAELIQQLADRANELGIEIDLNYSFHKRDE
jgi:hypothetical protein